MKSRKKDEWLVVGLAHDNTYIRQLHTFIDIYCKLRTIGRTPTVDIHYLGRLEDNTVDSKGAIEIRIGFMRLNLNATGSHARTFCHFRQPDAQRRSQ